MIVNEEATNRELCFGAIHTKVLAHREPEIPPSTVIFDGRWPKISCIISRRKGSKDSIIRVAVENSASTFGMLSNESAGAVAALYDGLAGGTVRFQCQILPQMRKPESSLGHMILEFEIIVYGKPSLFQNVGDLLSQKNIYLQQPLEYDKSARYQNPHYYVKQQRLKSGFLAQPKYQDVARTAEEIQQDVDQVFDKLMATEAKLPEKEAPDAIVTALCIPLRVRLIEGINIRNKPCIGFRREKRRERMKMLSIILVCGELDKRVVRWFIIILLPIRRPRVNLSNLEVVSWLMM